MTLFGDLHDLMKPPALYERTDAAFWDDEHISRGMLAAHLDPEFEGASRSFAFMDRSVDWICATAPPATHPRLLDLGCGPGLYAERFARAGYAVTGVDLSPRSLDHARRSANEQGLAIDYRCRNYLELDLDGSFDIAVMIYCDYGALSSDERRVAFASGCGRAARSRSTCSRGASSRPSRSARRGRSIPQEGSGTRARTSRCSDAAASPNACRLSRSR